MHSLNGRLATTATYSGDPFARIIAELVGIRESIDSLKADRPNSQPAAGAPWAIADAAKHLGVSDRHLCRMVKGGKVKAARLGRRLLIPATEVERLAREGVQE